MLNITSLTRYFLLKCLYQVCKVNGHAFKYVLVVSILLFSTIFFSKFDFETVPTVWYFISSYN